MKKLNKPTDNLGGVLKMWAIPVADFYLTGDTISFSSIDDVVEIYCSPDSISYEETSDQSEAGIYYNVTIKGFVPSDSDESRKILSEMEQRPFAVVFCDGNQNYRLAGNGFYPLRMKFDFFTGRTTSERSGFEITFSGKTLNMVVSIQNPF